MSKQRIRAYIPTLSKVDTSRGAPMGRPESLGRDRTDPVRLHVTRIRINSGGYDGGGAYWGLGQPLYLVEGYANEGTDLEETIRLFIRANDRPAAVEAVKKTFKNATFCRNR